MGSGRGRRWGAVGVAAVAAGVLGALSAASPAYAASGAGWAASWEYYANNAFELQVALPGGEVTAYTSDIGGQRHMDGVVEDTDGNDRTCVRVRVIATDNPALANETVCRGNNVDFHTVTFAGAVFVHLDLMIGNVIQKSTFTFVPSSVNDADLRTVGTATSWAYTGASQYHLEVHRPGVSVIGDGAHQGGGKRSVLAVVVDTGAAGSCAEGRAADALVSVVGAACGSGVQDDFNGLDFVGYIKLVGCYYPAGFSVRCLTMHFPEPY